MDEYDALLYEINREKKAKELKKFFRGKKWNKKQRKELEKQGKPPLELNQIKSCQEVQRELMREQMGLSDTEGLTLTKENMENLISELVLARPVFSGKILSNGVVYEDFSHFASALINKYFTKEEGD